MSRRHPDRELAGVNLGLIITPMLDMSFQILAFFIMTYHPSAMEGSVNGDLIPPSRVKTIGPIETREPAISVDEPDLSETVSVIVQAVPRGGIERHRGDGQPAAIYLKRTEDIDPVLVADSDEPLAESLTKLKQKLQRIQTVGDRKTLRLDCQPDLKNRYVIEIYDVCKDAGFEKISFVAPVAPKNEVK